MSVTEYINTISELWKELDLYHTASWCCTADDKQFLAMQEKEHVFDFFIGT